MTMTNHHWSWLKFLSFWKQSHSMKMSFTSYRLYRLCLTFRSIWGFWKWSQMISHSKKHGAQHQNDVSMQPAEAIVRSCHWEAWFFRNIFWPPQKNHEIGKKSKNGVHFISSVFKVVRVKVLSFLLFFAYFILFWGGGQNVLIFFSQRFFKTRQKSHEIGKN